MLSPRIVNSFDIIQRGPDFIGQKNKENLRFLLVEKFLRVDSIGYVQHLCKKDTIFM